jgi:multisubunit Na+/H+ antiporter MnhB subunit
MGSNPMERRKHMLEVSRATSLPRSAAIVLIIGIALALIANYTLDSLADTSATWHEIQHGAFFLGGILVGCALTQLYQVARSRA